MSTHAAIARKLDDGTFEAIYCHHDGYPEGVGATLAIHYSGEDNRERVEQLFANGGMSILGISINDCVFYASDRDEPFEDNAPVPFETVDLLRSNAGDFFGAEWLYVYDLEAAGRWSVEKAS